MKLSIRNFRGISHAEIELAPIALVAGLNEAGKTSVAQALQALLTGDPVPLDGLKRADAAMLIHAGTGSGAISLETDKGRAMIEYPKAKKNTDGEPPSATAAAVGLVSLPDMDSKDRSGFLVDYLRALPSREDLDKAVAAIKLTDEQAGLLWGTIEANGWDNAHTSAREKGVALKGAWREVTGENYGSAKAETWMPEAWEFGLEGASEDSLGALVTQAQEIRDASIAHTAISAERVATLETQADMAVPTRAELVGLQDAYAAAGARVVETLAALESVPKPDAEIETVACPYCSEPLVIRGNAVAKPPLASTSEENTRRRTVGEAASRDHTNASLALKSLGEKITEANRKLVEAERAISELDALIMGGEGPDDDALESARRDLQHAEGRLNAWRAKNRADRHHASIMRNQKVVDVLAPGGLRLSKLRHAVEAFNKTLRTLASDAAWASVEITESLEILYRGTAWPLCSESGKFRARVMLQVAFAAIDGSDALVIDGADMLDKGGRNGLIGLLKQAGRPALVCMTLNSKGDTPNLAKAGLGRSYWIEGAEAAEL